MTVESSREDANTQMLNHIIDMVEQIGADALNVLDGKDMISDEDAISRAHTSLKALLTYIENNDSIIDLTDKLEPIDETLQLER